MTESCEIWSHARSIVLYFKFGYGAFQPYEVGYERHCARNESNNRPVRRGIVGGYRYARRFLQFRHSNHTPPTTPKIALAVNAGAKTPLDKILMSVGKRESAVYKGFASDIAR